jgi:type III restriction enzyme
MLYEIFNSLKEAHGDDYFTSRVSEEIIKNLNPKFELREYQKEAIGRFYIYLNEYQKRKWPVHLLFHMATGSGKTLIMAANILYLYSLGYRNFIFFVNSTNIIEKTKDNFLNPFSDKYLFAPKIIFEDKEIYIKEVQNFEGTNKENINIIFTTIQGLHTRLNNPKENSLTEEDFEGIDIVLISDEAHHLQTITKQNKSELQLENSWEYTILEKIFNKNSKNILLEFTATIDLSNDNIRKKYEDKIIFQYDLKQFRLDKYSKEIEVLQADLEPIDRALQAVILSQYRRKIAEKYKVRLKPVILFKSKSIKESKENYDGFLSKIKNLSPKDIQEIESRVKGIALEKAFNHFKNENITYENLIKELQEDFSEEKVMLLDSENVDEEKQLKLNSLESRNNEIRAIFAVNMLNEGWDVLNLFDIVRLYNTRDGSWVRGKYKPGNTTLGEAQLIGRGARYFPFQLDETQDRFRRKFDEDISNELKIIETLHYHCYQEPKYIQEIKSTLTEIGILPERTEQLNLFIKDSFKKSDFWNKGYIYINERKKNPRTTILSFQDIDIKNEYTYELKTGDVKEEFLFDDIVKLNQVSIPKTKMECNLFDFGINVIRSAMDKIEFYNFNNLKKYFPNLSSVNDFITASNYLGGVKVKILSNKYNIDNLTQTEKLKIAFYVLKEIADQTKTKTSEFIGTTIFKAKLLREVFRDKILKFSIDDLRAKGTQKINLETKDWYAQNELYGTSEEQDFIEFFDGFINKLRTKYSDIALLRNEKFFQIFSFDDGQAFEPDFVLFLKKKNHQIYTYQVFIEPKGDLFKDNQGRFENSKEGWKQKFLLELEKKADTDINFENNRYKIFGLPFYNKKLEKEFEEALENKFLS